MARVNMLFLYCGYSVFVFVPNCTYRIYYEYSDILIYSAWHGLTCCSCIAVTLYSFLFLIVHTVFTMNTRTTYSWANSVDSSQTPRHPVVLDIYSKKHIIRLGSTYQIVFRNIIMSIYTKTKLGMVRQTWAQNKWGVRRRPWKVSITW